MLKEDGAGGLSMDEVEDPFALFAGWMEEATATEVNDPNAMSLATATAGGLPAVRIVLLKGVDARGFWFYTNAESRKGEELRGNAEVALCFHWKTRQRQVRVEGAASEVPAEDADGYFRRRHRMSQIGAWASAQSRPLGSRDELMRRTAEVEARFPGEVPRPPYWTGFVVKPRRIEFWQEGEYRLHDRVVFEADGAGGWTRQRLFP